MATMRYQPWAVVSQLQDEINRVFGNLNDEESSSATAEWMPAVDVREYSDRFELLVDLPGVDRQGVEITLDNGVLTLSGERREEKSSDSSGPGYDHPARAPGTASRPFFPTLHSAGHGRCRERQREGPSRRARDFYQEAREGTAATNCGDVISVRLAARAARVRAANLLQTISAPLPTRRNVKS